MCSLQVRWSPLYRVRDLASADIIQLTDERRRSAKFDLVLSETAELNHSSTLCRNAPPNDQVANFAEAQAARRIAFMNPRGGFFLLPTSRAFPDGLLRRPSAVARMGNLRRLTNTNVFRGLPIVREILCTRVKTSNCKLSTLRCVRISVPPVLIRGIPSRARLSPLRHSN